jgi:hypothetical protein
VSLTRPSNWAMLKLIREPCIISTPPAACIRSSSAGEIALVYLPRRLIVILKFFQSLPPRARLADCLVA